MANVFAYLREGTGMGGFDLDLKSVEDHLPNGETGEGGEGPRVVLGILDGTTPAEEWLDHVEGGDVLVLDVKGNVNELAAGFARDVKDDGGSLIRFRGFLIVSPGGMEIDTDRLESD